MAGQLITNTIDKKLATTTWLGEKLLPANYNIDIPGNYKSFNVTYTLKDSKSCTISYNFSHYNSTLKCNVFHGIIYSNNLPNSSPATQTSSSLLNLFVPDGYDITKTVTSNTSGIWNCKTKTQNLTGYSLNDGELYTLNQLRTKTLITNIAVPTSALSVKGYNSGGIEFGNNYIGGSGTGQIISGLSATNYDYHAIKNTEYYDIFGVNKADSKCIKETDTSNIEVHYIYPVIGRLYSSYNGYNSDSSPIATTTNNDWVIVPPYTLGYWYYNSTKLNEMKQYNPFNACIFEYPSDAGKFGGKNIGYGNATAGTMAFNNIFLHTSSSVSVTDVYTDLSEKNAGGGFNIVGKSILYEGCYYRPNQYEPLDIREIDRLYVLQSNITKRTPCISPSIFAPGKGTKPVFTSSESMNSISKIVAYKVKVGPVKGNDFSSMTTSNYYPIYKHPTLYSATTTSTSVYGPSYGYNSNGYYLNSVPVIHVPSSIELTSDADDHVITVNKSGLGSSRNLVLTFKNIKVNVYDAAYASNVSDVKKLNLSDVNRISVLCDDLYNAKFRLEVDCYYTNTHAGNVDSTTLEYEYSGYNFTQSADSPLVLTGTPLQSTVTIPFSEFGRFSYYQKFYCRLYMEEIPNKFIFGSPTSYIRSGERRIGYDCTINVDTLPAAPSPSAKGVPMEIGEYDE